MMRRPLPLVMLLGLTGCYSPNVLRYHPEQKETFTRVFLYPVGEDPRLVHPKIAERLRGLGYTVLDPAEDRPGNQDAAMRCHYSYRSGWNLWWRFYSVRIRFSSARTGKVILRVHLDSLEKTFEEDWALDALFEEAKKEL
jgi:hypothetical protein